MKKIALISSALVATPFIASAQADLGFLNNFLAEVGNVINAAVPIVIGLAVLLFLWGLARYMLNQDDAEARAGARSIMIWGIVINFVMVAIWGLVGILAGLFGLSGGEAAVDTSGLIPVP